MDEPGSSQLRAAMESAAAWFVCRIGYVEVARALELAAGGAPAGRFRDEWPAFGVLEVDQALAESAASLAGEHRLRSLDALHLAAALVLPRAELCLATWDRRLHGAARASGVRVLPRDLAA